MWWKECVAVSQVVKHLIILSLIGVMVGTCKQSSAKSCPAFAMYCKFNWCAQGFMAAARSGPPQRDVVPYITSSDGVVVLPSIPQWLQGFSLGGLPPSKFVFPWGLCLCCLLFLLHFGNEILDYVFFYDSPSLHQAHVLVSRKWLRASCSNAWNHQILHWALWLFRISYIRAVWQAHVLTSN